VMIAVMVTDWPCTMVFELPPLKLIESTGGGVPPPQPDRIAALRHPNAIKVSFLGPCVANLPKLHAGWLVLPALRVT
jgi:hypothetical protein